MAVNKEIGLVRALVKLSSALYDIDDIKEDKRYKHYIKKSLNTWQDWSEEYIKKPINAFSLVEPDTLLTLIQLFDNTSKHIFIIDEFTTKINLILSKLESALYDLKRLDLEDSEYKIYIDTLSNTIEELVSHNYFNRYINYVDPDGNNYQSIITILNDIGDKVIVGTVE